MVNLEVYIPGWENPITKNQLGYSGCIYIPPKLQVCAEYITFGKQKLIKSPRDVAKFFIDYLLENRSQSPNLNYNYSGDNDFSNELRSDNSKQLVEPNDAFKYSFEKNLRDIYLIADVAIERNFQHVLSGS